MMNNIDKRNTVTVILLTIYLVSQFFFSHNLIGQSVLAFTIIVGSILVLTKRKLYFNSFVTSYLILIFWGILTNLSEYSINNSQSWSMLATLMINFVVLFIVSNLFIDLSVNQLVRVVALSIFIFSFLLLLIEVLYGFSGRLGGVYYFLGLKLTLNPNINGYLISIGVILFFYQKIIVNRFVSKIIAFILLPVVILTGSRTAFFALMIGLLIFLWIHSKHKIISLLSFIIFGFFTYMLLLYIPVLYSYIGYRVQDLMNFVLHGSTIDTSLVVRFNYYKIGLENFIISPILGYGFDNFRFLRGSYGTYSHSNFIELLISAGLIGTLIYYTPLVLSQIKGSVSKSHVKKDIALMILLVSIISDFTLVSYYERSLLLILTFSLTLIESNFTQKSLTI